MVRREAGKPVKCCFNERNRRRQVKKIKFENWFAGRNPEGMLWSEKLDGVYAEWTGKKFVSKNGNRFHAPDWFCAGLPTTPLRGELFGGRGQFAKTVGIVRSRAAGDAWRAIKFVVWDCQPYAGRTISEFAEFAQHETCQSQAHLEAQLDSINFKGGEGIILLDNRTGIRYKVKTMHDAEAIVIGKIKGKGIQLRLANGTKFGAGICPEFIAKISDVVTFRYLRLSPAGVPISANVWRKYNGQ